MSSNLTVLLPLKGRPLFTLRFLWHATASKLPYKFVIADGGEKKFPLVSTNLDIDYIKFPPDKTLKDYYLKMSLAMERVTTPYVMRADNDDFLIRSGIDYCTKFLGSHADYVSASGGIAGFSVRGNVAGPINKWSLCYSPRDMPVDIDSDNPDVRVKRGMRSTWCYYSVYRAEVLKRLFREVLDLKPSHLGVTERFMAARTMELGKAKNEAGVFSYARQYWTSLQDHGVQDTAQIAADLQAVIRRVPVCRDEMGSWFNDAFGSNTHATIRGILPKVLRTWFKHRYRPSVTLERGRMLKAGFWLDELQLIERVLTGEAFKEFLDVASDSWDWRAMSGPERQDYRATLSGEPVSV